MESVDFNRYTSLSLLCVWELSCKTIWSEYFSSEGQVLCWNFLVLNVYGNVFNWVPKLLWPPRDWFWSFLLEYASFGRRHVCNDWLLLQELLICVSFFDNMKYFRWLVWGSFWSVLYLCLYLLAVGFFNIHCWALSIHFKFTSHVWVFFSTSF